MYHTNISKQKLSLPIPIPFISVSRGVFRSQTNIKDRVPCKQSVVSPLSANPRKWINTLKQFVGKLPTNYLSVFDHFVKLALKGLAKSSTLHM